VDQAVAVADIASLLAEVVGGAHVVAGTDISDDFGHDEALTVPGRLPAAVVFPATTAEVAELVGMAAERGIPLTARGSGTGLSGACVPLPGGVVVSFERMNTIVEIDTDNHVAVVQPGVTLQQLDAATAPAGLVYPVAPGETSASLGGNVPPIVASGLGPLMVEYLDLVTMAAIVETGQLDLGIPTEIKDRALAYLVLVLEQRRDDRLDEDVDELATMVADLGALDVYVLPPQAGGQLIEARENAFWTAKAAGADDIIDMVVPRASMPTYMRRVSELAQASGSWVAGCGHAGDGNVHLSVFQADPGARHQLIHDLFAAGMALGGAISGEHGIGWAKKAYVADLEDPAKLALWRRIKTAFDPAGILNPGAIFDLQPAS
jgi:FAD/FMN-containing dehydrogenase